MLHAVATQRPQQALGIGSSVYPYKTKHTCDCTHTDIADSPLEALSIERRFCHLLILMSYLMTVFLLSFLTQNAFERLYRHQNLTYLNVVYPT